MSRSPDAPPISPCQCTVSFTGTSTTPASSASAVNGPWAFVPFSNAALPEHGPSTFAAAGDAAANVAIPAPARIDANRITRRSIGPPPSLWVDRTTRRRGWLGGRRCRKVPCGRDLHLRPVVSEHVFEYPGRGGVGAAGQPPRARRAVDR